MRTSIAFAAVLTISASIATAQTPATPVAAPVVEGLALDSLHKGFLRGAIIMVEGSTATTTTDSLGRFRLEGLSAGSHRIGVIHPLLDSLGISLLTQPLTVAPGEPTHLTVSVPSPRTTVGIKCSDAERVLGPAALVGFVVFSESESPAAGASVNLEWVDFEVTKTSVRAVPRRRAAKVDQAGRFQICGLPEQLEALLSAESSTDTTTEVNVRIPGVLGIAALELAEPSANAAARPSATLTGTILDPGGRPLERARVSVDSVATLSGPDGKFTLRNLKSGTRSLLVRRIGFDVTSKVIALRERNATDVTVAMNPFTPLLDTVVVKAIAGSRALERVGFNRRKQVGAGFFLGPEEISRRNASRLTDLLAMAPNLRRTFVNGQPVISGRLRGAGLNLYGSCVVYVVDGIQWRSGGGVDEFVMPAEVAAIEVYSRNFTPMDYDPSMGECETVLVWTKWKVGVR